MFTGIIETLGKVTNLVSEQDNLHITVSSNITNELKIDQSVAHNGVCLTVVGINENEYTVTAIKETLNKTNIGALKIDSIVNLERAMKLGDRLDGHIVQGHVDQVGKCIKIIYLVLLSHRTSFHISWIFCHFFHNRLSDIISLKGNSKNCICFYLSYFNLNFNLLVLL